MRIERIHLHDFRNLADCLVDLSPQCTVLWGRNAQGKTNILEGIYFLATLRGFRPGTLGDLVRWGASQAHLAARVRRDAAERHLEVTLRSGRRTVRVDGRPVRDYADAAGNLVAVLFAPEHLALVRGAAALRRQFVDRALMNVDPSYYAVHKAFSTALRSRNALLRAHAPQAPPRRLLAAFDEQLCEHAAAITVRRARFVRSFSEPARRAHARIAPNDAPLALRYRSGIPGVQADAVDPEDVERALRRALDDQLARDAARGTTGAGPQLDDLELCLGQRPARLAASQGQQRTIALALKMAEVDWTHAGIGSWPVLLLDDVVGELDAQRRAALLEFVVDIEAQVAVTTTDGDVGLRGTDVVWVRVEAGEVFATEAP